MHSELAAGVTSPPTSEGTATDTSGRPDHSFRDALILVGRHYGRDISSEALLSGLPIEDGILRPAMVERAAARIGLVAKPVARSVADIPGLVLPAIIVTKAGEALVLMRRSGDGDGTPDRLHLLRPGPTGPEVLDLPEPDVAGNHSGYAFLIAPMMQEDQRATGPLPPPHWFWSRISAFRDNYLNIAIAALLINILALAFPLFVMNVYDRVLPNGATASLIALTIGVLIAFAFDFVLRMVRSRIIDLTSKQVDMNLSADLFAHLLGIRLANRPASAGVLANQIREFESVREFMTSGTVISAADLFFAIIFIAVMFFIVGPLALVPLLLLPVVIGVCLLVQRPLDRAVAATQRQSAVRHGILVEAMSQVETIRTLGAENRVQGHWERSVAAAARTNEAVHHYSSLSLTLTTTLQNLASLLVIVWGVFLVLDNQITVGALVAANMLLGRILAPVGNLASILTRAVRAVQAFKGIDQLLQLPVERPPGQRFVARSVSQGTLIYDSVTFRYADADRDALQNVSFSIAAGEKVGIIGRIGSGKTTIGKLAAGLYAPSEGHILIDGVDLRQYDPTDLRQGVGFVSQDCQLFHGTLRDNITIGKPDASDAEIVAAARLSGVEAFAQHSPAGYEMRIGEGGYSMSGGQRQAIALARALIRQPRILFLDEPTSALDLRSEAELCERVAAMQAGMTLIVSTHRLSLLRIVDRLIVLEQGRIIADGPRDEVLAKLNGRSDIQATAGGRR